MNKDAGNIAIYRNKGAAGKITVHRNKGAGNTTVNRKIALKTLQLAGAGALLTL